MTCTSTDVLDVNLKTENDLVEVFLPKNNENLTPKKIVEVDESMQTLK